MSSAQEKVPLGRPGCLCGRGLGFVELRFDRHFLNCRYGRDRTGVNHSTADEFLSCLHGREHTQGVVDRVVLFLSCLHGSELLHEQDRDTERFLSCLCGDEPQGQDRRRAAQFLSSLYGSPRSVPLRARTGTGLRQRACDSQHRARHE